MAGVYRRFREAGYTTPKFLLPWRGRTVLDHILDGLLHGGAFAQVVLVANRRDEAHGEAIASCLDRVGRPRWVLIDATNWAERTVQSPSTTSTPS
jgi:CTP:molybdopterin cytidylyltransferase MocA